MNSQRIIQMYVVIGATGNTGRVITETLPAKGKKVRAIGPLEKRSAANTTPTPFEQFAETFVAVYRSRESAKGV
jgi:uncharacterized protein YbjT (DUF2867 family)